MWTRHSLAWWPPGVFSDCQASTDDRSVAGETFLYCHWSVVCRNECGAGMCCISDNRARWCFPASSRLAYFRSRLLSAASLHTFVWNGLQDCRRGIKMVWSGDCGPRRSKDFPRPAHEPRYLRDIETPRFRIVSETSWAPPSFSMCVWWSLLWTYNHCSPESSLC